MVESLAMLIGLLGVATVIAAYGLLTTKKMSAQSPRYQWLNVLGTSGILISLTVQWNLPAFIANAAWLVIGVVSLRRNRRRRAA